MQSGIELKAGAGAAKKAAGVAKKAGESMLNQDRHSKVECRRQQEQMEDHSRDKNRREVPEIREDRDQKTMQGESHREEHRLRSSKCPILANRLKTDKEQQMDSPAQIFLQDLAQKVEKNKRIRQLLMQKRYQRMQQEQVMPHRVCRKCQQASQNQLRELEKNHHLGDQSQKWQCSK